MASLEDEIGRKIGVEGGVDGRGGRGVGGAEERGEGGGGGWVPKEEEGGGNKHGGEEHERLADAKATAYLNVCVKYGWGGG